MNFLKKLTGLFVFVLAIAGAVAVSRYFSGPRPEVTVETPPPPPPPNAPAKPPQFDADKLPPPELAPPVPVYFRVRLVTLDFSKRKSHVTLELERHRASTAPERVWAWVSFYSPEDGGRCAAEPVEVRQPFARGDRATVVVESDASGCARPRAPGATLYARANVSAASPEAARLDASRLFDDLTKATPVVVAGATTN